MKQFKKLAMILMAVCTLGVFNACGSDDDNTGSSLDLSTATQAEITAIIVGNWDYTEDGAEAGEKWTNRGTWSFMTDGSCSRKEWDDEDNEWTDKKEKYWDVTKKNEKWYLSIDQGKYNYEIQKISQNSFVLYKEYSQTDYSRYTFKRK